MKDKLEQALEDVDLLTPMRKEETPESLEGWIPVVDEAEGGRGGIIAYFADEDDAAHFRLAYINARLNPIGGKR